MASTYDNDLRLEEMATGENSGSWGTKTNTNLELIADAFSYGTETIADADTTIEIQDGTADAARSLALKINSSTNLTTTRVITLAPNTTSKVWIIENNTGGDQVLTISAGSGTNITLANGTTKIIATDGIGAGSNVVELTQDLAIADMSVDGILSLADGSNSAPSLTNTGDLNTGLYFPAADEVGLTVGGTQRLNVSATGIDVTGGITADGLLTSGTDVGLNSEYAVLGDDTSNRQLKFTQYQTGGANDNAGHKINAASGYGELALAVGGTTRLLTTTTGIDITGGFTANAASTIATTDNSVNLTLTSTDTDGSAGPVMEFYRNSANPADNDSTGLIYFTGENDADEKVFYGQIFSQIQDASNGTEDSSIDFITMVAGTGRSRMYLFPTETVFNDASVDLDFRVESDANTHALFVDAGLNKVLIGSSGAPNVNPASSRLYDAVVDNGISIGNGGYTHGFIGTGGTDGNVEVVANSYPANAGSERYVKIKGGSSGGGGPNEMAHFASGIGAVFNDAGSNFMDFRVESDSNANMLFVDAGNNRIGVGTSNPLAVLDIHGSTNAYSTMAKIYLTDVSGHASSRNWSIGNGGSDYGAFTVGVSNAAGGDPQAAGTHFNPMIISKEGNVVFNEDSKDADFRVESDTNTHMLFLDAGGEYINVNTSATYLGGKLNVGGNKTLNNGIPTQQLVVADFTALRAGGGGAIQFNGIYDSSNNLTTAGSIEAYKRNATSGDYGFGLQFKSRTNGATNVERLYMDQANTTFNQSGDNTDFRVESDTISDAFSVDGGTGVVSANGSAFTVGNHTGSFNQDGTYISNNSGSFMYMERSGSGNSVMYIHRRTSDGNLIEFHSQAVIEGSISVAGTTVSYNGFCGTHDSSGATVSISTPVGTVLSTIDEEHKSDHAKVKVSDSVGDKRVYGVLQQYKETTTSDDTGHTQLEHAVVASVGIASVRVTGACEGGDLLESNGDGTAKVQSDDIVRSKTLGKVTIGNSDTGVKLVSCVMYCG